MKAQNQAIADAAAQFLNSYTGVTLKSKCNDYLIETGHAEFIVKGQQVVETLVSKLSRAFGKRADVFHDSHGVQYSIDLTSTRRVWVMQKFGEDVEMGLVDFACRK